MLYFFALCADNTTGDFMYKRAITAFFLFCICLGMLCVKLFTLSFKVDAAEHIQSHCKKITLDNLRLPMLDCNGELLCNYETESFVAVKPTYDILPELREILPRQELASLAQTIAHQSPAYAKLSGAVELNNLNAITLKKYVRYPDGKFLCHLTGYVNSDGAGVSGIEKAFDTTLKTDIPLYAGFPCSADGQIIAGAKIETEPLYYSEKCGIKLTIDKKIQLATEEALENSTIKKGAVLVCDTKTGAIKALASVPFFDKNNVASSLEDDNAPLVNRALSAYPVGSVFKAAVAAAALEYGISPAFSMKCTGSYTVDGKVFHCNNGTAHGVVDMQKALVCSCNCYFIKLTQQMGHKPLLELAGILGYGKSFEIAKNLFASEGNLPTAEKLRSTGQLALFSFGQGTLTATTIQIANTFTAIGNNGQYTEPYVVENLTDAKGRELYRFTPKAPIRAFSEETAQKLTKMLKSVVKEGTAKNAQSELFESAGKTATAQTGTFNPDKSEKLCTWFGGFFPADDPKYTVVILNEEGTTGGEDCAPVFKEIAEKIF